jgi:flagellar motor switch protein FliG
MSSQLPQGSLAALPSGSERSGPEEIVAGPRKAAVLMAALGPERAAKVIGRMREDEIESLSGEMARLEGVGAETTDSVFHEMAEAGLAGSGANGGIDFARDVIERALGPERAVELLGRIAGPAEARPFEFLRRVAPERIASIVRGESHQAIALVLANLPATLAAGVLSKLPEAQQPDIALRIARMGETTAPVIEKLEQAIRIKLTSTSERELTVAGGTKALAGILNHADRSLERNVLDNLASTDKDLEERAVQQVLREVDQKDLVLALRGVPENVKEVILSNMSERGAAMLKEEMEIQPPQRKKDVDDAQSRVVAVVRKLEEAGTIVIPGGEGEQGDPVV